MKVTCDRSALVESLNLVGTVIVTRTPKPVLTCVKISAEADGQGLVLAATDLEAAVRITCPRVEVQQPGEALIPADKLSQIVRESLDPTITLEVDQNVAHIQAADSHFKIYGHAVEDFPPIPVLDSEADFELTGAALAQLVHQTLFATARESTRFAFNGVLIERDGTTVSAVATDSRRLALARAECEPIKNGQAGRHSAIVPARALGIALRVFQDPEQTIRVRISDNQVLLNTDDALLASNLIEGNFPPYQDVIPREFDRKAKIGTEVLASAVRRAALLTNEESRGVRMSFGPEGLKLSSRAPEMGEAEINVELPDYNGSPLEIGFNPQFVTDALKVAGSEEVTIELKSPTKPGKISVGPNFLYVIMPVNLQ